jgi:phenylalanyl-tRNA synthetase alpha chain
MIDAATFARLRDQFTADLAAAVSVRDLQTLRDRYLGRKNGLIPGLWEQIAQTPAEVKRELGRLANDLKRTIETELAGRLDAAAARTPAVPPVDVTLPGRDLRSGHRHPITALRERIEGIFARWGYEVLDGPESEDDWHNFEALNMPQDHPARDMQDTLYLAQPLARDVWTDGHVLHAAADAPPATLLRTHTSAMQIRYMERHRPPVRIIAPGRVYRRDNLDLTHTPMFQQVEGLAVSEHVSLADLKGTLVAFLRELFDEDTRVLFRPSFFPYTEPSAEVCIGCLACRGAGCAMCKRTGWLEVLGSGMVHPAVFEAVGYDPERYTGFAFGVGLERIALLKYGVEDIRLFYENDLRFLEQFPV